ncbi:MAG: aspartate carbamoyltransferase catalytic subunit [Phycisphaerales bacterium JB040]
MSRPNHLLSAQHLSPDSARGLLARARELRVMPHDERSRVLRGHSLATLFFENSTRTRVSFTQAAHNLGATAVDLNASSSSLAKGESLLDTAHTVEAMGVSALAVRHAQSGAPGLIAEHVAVPVLNAGDGAHEHPTQALADALTIADAVGPARGFDLSGLSVAIVGDVLHSRVARSNAWLLSALGARVTLVGPESLCPPVLGEALPVAVSHDLDATLGASDAVMLLRVQFERGTRLDDTAQYRDRYALTADRAARMRPGALIMHPGPMNRGTEIDDDVADGLVGPARVVIREQVASGVAVRMSALEAAVTGAPALGGHDSSARGSTPATEGATVSP